MLSNASLAAAGPLNPPAGAIASTGKTLTEVEPRTAVNAVNTPAGSNHTYVITASGSYYLTADLISSGTTNGLLINAPRVTLDLNGFSIVNGGTGQFGILLNAHDQNVTIRNGTVSGWGSLGIGHNGGNAPAISVENIFFRNCARGIRVPGPLRVTRCTARNCSIIGFECMSPHALFESCLAEACTSVGFYLNPYSVAQGCIANACGTGFFGNDGSRFIDCSATANTSLGFDLGAGVLLHRCTARGNGSANAAGNGNIRAGVRALITQCLSDSGFYRGILTNHAGAISDCVVTSCSGTGIETGDGCSVERCNVSNNSGNGVQIAADCRIHGNIIDYHTGAGASAVRCIGGSNSIEQNTLTRAAVGVDMTNSVNNVVLNNRVSCTTPFAVNFGGNWYPQITAANTGAGASPFANVTY